MGADDRRHDVSAAGADRARSRPQYGLSAVALLALGATMLVAPALQ
jgi:hypothetical protein